METDAGGVFSEYGADVDDSVSCQVYQNIAPQRLLPEPWKKQREDHLPGWSAGGGVLFFDPLPGDQYG